MRIVSPKVFFTFTLQTIRRFPSAAVQPSYSAGARGLQHRIIRRTCWTAYRRCRPPYPSSRRLRRKAGSGPQAGTPVQTVPWKAPARCVSSFFFMKIPPCFCLRAFPAGTPVFPGVSIDILSKAQSVCSPCGPGTNRGLPNRFLRSNNKLHYFAGIFADSTRLVTFTTFKKGLAQESISHLPQQLARTEKSLAQQLAVLAQHIVKTGGYLLPAWDFPCILQCPSRRPAGLTRSIRGCSGS